MEGEVTDHELIKKIRSIIFDQWDIKENDTNYIPAPQPVSLERKDIKKLIENDYLVSIKTDGTRYLMLHCDANIYMIDRSFKIFKTILTANTDQLFIIDGELITCYNDKLTYIIHDCICIDGIFVGKLDFLTRYNKVDDLIRSINSENLTITLTKKHFYGFKKLKELVKIINEGKYPNYKTDGFIFVPKNERIGKFTQYNLFKWKPIESHTFDFKINVSKNGIMAYVNKNKLEDHPYAHAQSGTDEERIFLENLKKNCPNFKNGDIVECEFDIISGLYKPIKLRTDKIYPNSLFTISKTLINIKENITIQELIELTEQFD